MKHIIIGLGNPGSEYEKTRHNVGWIILNNIVTRHNLPSFSKSSMYSGLLSEGTLYGTEVGILLPTTFMNNSGLAVVKYLKDTGAQEILIVVHDDIDIAYGDIRVSFDRGAGGHNGIRSIIDAYGTSKFIRIRVGIAQKGFFGGLKRPKGEELSQFVLGTFKSGEVTHLPEIIEKVDTALESIVKDGLQKAMQVINT